MLFRPFGGDGPRGQKESESVKEATDYHDRRDQADDRWTAARAVPDQHSHGNHELTHGCREKKASSGTKHEQLQQALLVWSPTVPVRQQLTPDEVEPQKTDRQQQLGGGARQTRVPRGAGRYVG